MTIPVSYEIEDEVPVPVRATPIPLKDLEVGQSFVFPLRERPKVQTYASRYNEIGKRFTVKKIDKDNCRVWRTQ